MNSSTFYTTIKDFAVYFKHILPVFGKSELAVQSEKQNKALFPSRLQKNTSVR